MTREEATERIEFLRDHAYNYYIGRENGVALEIALEALKQPEQKKAKFVQKEHWVALAWDCGPFSYEPEDYNEETHSERRFYWHCSNCGKEASRNIKPTAKYCSECGAKMEEEE